MTRDTREIIGILHELQCLKADMNAISDHDAIYKKFIYRHEPISRIFFNSYKLFNIGLAKVLDPREHFCLSNYIDNLISDEKQEWKRFYDKSKLVLYKDEIVDFQNTYLKEIKVMRDKFFAHTDRNRRDAERYYNLADAYLILSRMQEIFEDILLHLDDRRIKFELVDDITSDLIALYKYNCIREIVNSEDHEVQSVEILKNIKEIVNN